MRHENGRGRAETLFNYEGGNQHTALQHIPNKRGEQAE